MDSYRFAVVRIRIRLTRRRGFAAKHTLLGAVVLHCRAISISAHYGGNERPVEVDQEEEDHSVAADIHLHNKRPTSQSGAAVHLATVFPKQEAVQAAQLQNRILPLVQLSQIREGVNLI